MTRIKRGTVTKRRHKRLLKKTKGFWGQRKNVFMRATETLKRAMAFAFNVIGIGLIVSGNIALGIVGVILIVIMQLIVFALGSLSSGIQAIRLHYVEFFMKFYKGEGIKFNPFRYVRKYTKTE